MVRREFGKESPAVVETAPGPLGLVPPEPYEKCKVRN